MPARALKTSPMPNVPYDQRNATELVVTVIFVSYVKM